MENVTRDGVFACMREVMAGTIYRFPNAQELWLEYRSATEKNLLQVSPELEKALRVKDVRTDSGVAPITVLTKPWACPGRCVYCPTEVRMPKSYISSEPAAARALSLKFDPYQQVAQRVKALERNGHEAKKIELIIKGGTWSNYPWNYRRWFIKRCFDAANELPLLTQEGSDEADPTEPSSPPLTPPSPEGEGLAEALKKNESAAYRIIGLTIETRPDWVNAEEIKRLREIGCTRVELGVQTLRDEILQLTKRGHTVADVERATVLLKTAGFKVDYHFLPGQPGMTPKKDLEDFETLFGDARFRPDMIKIYPCVVLPNSELKEWADRGEFTPLDGRELIDLLVEMKSRVPRYCRISRLIRDFPSKDISFGNKVTNLREYLTQEMERRGLSCRCLRCREVGHTKIDTNVATKFFIEEYESAGGRELFLTIEDEARKAVFAFLRLRLPQLSSRPSRARGETFQSEDPSTLLEMTSIYNSFPVLRDAAIVRELHTYGTALDLKQTRSDAAQHKGYGRRLMEEAEKIAAQEGYEKMAVISGIGVRAYYEMLGYEEQDTYMVKKI
ncbi:MAG: tRNA uridine(34) 5-carboxymethylaminomethyl modification radical SAM/GNAT enzyme Elp3 [Patescibacteria group bacterium]|nr:tRNA uridine(34) 5-carboxymethylaminomethyl modification radical SAM/GNAT enzyme Elp3 [Patescibacteria group bacterium]